MRRKEYKMSDKDLEKMRDATRTAIAIVNEAWQELGAKMGFDWETAESIPDKGPNWFSAIPLKRFLSEE